MRVRLWLSSIAGLLIFTSASNVQAQHGGFPAPVTTSFNAQTGTYTTVGAMQGGGPSYYQEGLPPGQGFAPNPYSQYGGYDSSPLPDRGVFETILGTSFNSRVRFNAAFTRVVTKSPDAVVVGDSRVSTKVHFLPDDEDDDDDDDDGDDGDDGDDDEDAPGNGGTIVFIPDPPGPASVNDLYLDGTDPWGPVTVDEIYDQGPANGIDLNLYVETPGGSGLMINGFYNMNYQSGQQWGDRSNLELDFSNDPVTRVTETGIGFPNDDELDYRLSVFYPGIPYYTGVPLEADSDFSLGDAINFDVYAEMKFETQSYGLGMTQALSPVLEGKSFSLRPLIGVQYLGINEAFSLFGRQSGLGYVVQFPDGTLSDFVNTGFPMTDTVVDSKVNSNLFGPQAGFGMTLGGRNFRIVTSHKFGLMANRERIKLRGHGVYNDFRVLEFAVPDDYNQFPFDETETYTHLSPMTTHSITAECNVLQNLPILRDIDFFDEAVLSIGYNITQVWEVARPGSTIQWNGAPLTPDIEANRERFWFGGFEFGVSFGY